MHLAFSPLQPLGKLSSVDELNWKEVFLGLQQMLPGATLSTWGWLPGCPGDHAVLGLSLGLLRVVLQVWRREQGGWRGLFSLVTYLGHQGKCKVGLGLIKSAVSTCVAWALVSYQSHEAAFKLHLLQLVRHGAGTGLTTQVLGSKELLFALCRKRKVRPNSTQVC